jgi:hypothetical protein
MSNPQTFLLIVAVEIVLGYLLIKNKLTFLAWPSLLFWLMLTGALFFKATPIFKMLAMIVVTLNAMKTIVTAISYQSVTFKLSFLQWVAFSTGWVGMRAQAFERLFGKSLPGTWQLIKNGLIRVLIGVALLLLAPTLTKLPVDTRTLFIVTSGIMLVGLSLILHFGALSISAGVWRFFGADTYLLFRQPAKSNSLVEFWGRRWNLAFIEMLSIAVLRPLKAKIGNTTAIFLSFLLSGLLHEVAITLPVSAGFGMPTLYFIIQGCAVAAEKKMEKQSITLLKNKLIAKLWVLFWLIAPIYFLFPSPFIEQVVWPLANLNGVW